MVPSSPQTQLHASSRLNYSKVYTIEYNVKVRFIGHIHPNSGHLVVASYNEIHQAINPFASSTEPNIPPPVQSYPAHNNYYSTNQSSYTPSYGQSEYGESSSQSGYGFAVGQYTKTSHPAQTTPDKSTKVLHPPTIQESFAPIESSYITESKSEQASIFDQSDHGIVSSKTDVSMLEHVGLEEQGKTPQKGSVVDGSIDIDSRSLVSAEDDIHSQTARVTTAPVIEAEKQLGKNLAHNEELKTLFSLAISGRCNNGREGFIKNIRRLLKWYHMDLHDVAVTNLEKASAELIRGHGSRKRISSHISEIISPLDEKHLEVQTKKTDKHDFLRNWMEGNQGFEESAPVPPDDILETSSNSSGEEENVSRPESKLKVAEKFMLEGESFQKLSTRLQLWLLPSSLPSLNRILLSIPIHNIWLSNINDYSISNLCKILIENATEDDWHWWPLRPKMRMLKKGESRINWTCVSYCIFY